MDLSSLSETELQEIKKTAQRIYGDDVDLEAILRIQDELLAHENPLMAELQGKLEAKKPHGKDQAEMAKRIDELQSQLSAASDNHQCYKRTVHETFQTIDADLREALILLEVIEQLEWVEEDSQLGEILYCVKACVRRARPFE